MYILYRDNKKRITVTMQMDWSLSLHYCQRHLNKSILTAWPFRKRTKKSQVLLYIITKSKKKKKKLKYTIIEDHIETNTCKWAGFHYWSYSTKCEHDGGKKFGLLQKLLPHSSFYKNRMCILDWNFNHSTWRWNVCISSSLQCPYTSFIIYHLKTF